MNAKNYNVSELFSLAFGIKPPAFQPQLISKELSPSTKYKDVKAKPKEPISRMSWLGTEILYPTKFQKGIYKIYNPVFDVNKPNEMYKNIGLEDYYLPPATIINFSRKKLINKTNVLGSNGTVKEIFGLDDWQIHIQSLCLNEPNYTAHEQIKELLKWENLADSIKVVGKLFTDKSIFAISIEDIEIKQIEGKPDVIPFVINAISDEPLELIQ